MADEARVPGFVGSHNPKLSALRIVDPVQFLRIMNRAIRNHNGNMSAVAAALGIGTTTIKRWMADHPDLKALVDAARADAARKRTEAKTK